LGRWVGSTAQVFREVAGYHEPDLVVEEVA
jgi:hypothetical protein